MDLAPLIVGSLSVLTLTLVVVWYRTRHRWAGAPVSELLPRPYDLGRLAAFVRSDDPQALDAPAPQLEREGIFEWSHADPVAAPRVRARGAGASSAAVAGAVPLGAGAVHQYLAIDDHVYEGISRLAGTQFESLGDLSARVQTYNHDVWSGLTQKTLDKVGGHIAEPYAAEHFADAGIAVEWPAASNQAGWDLLLDGHEVNVKLVADASSLSEHFAKYPGIPAVIPGDAANIPADAVHFDPTEGIGDLLEALSDNTERLVIVDEALSHADVMAQAADATDVLVGSADVLDSAAPGIPIVTLAFSGWREAKLLKNAQTDLGTAAKNISLDVAGTGAGGFAGLKGGALAGTALGGPVGAVIGGILGGIGGALAGRAVSNGVKELPFKEAVGRLKDAEGTLRHHTEEEGQRAERAFEGAKATVQAELRRQAEAEQAALAAAADEIRTWRAGRERLNPQHAFDYVSRALAELDAVDQQLPQRGVRPLAFLLPQADRESIEAASNAIAVERRKLEQLRAEVARLEVVDRATVFQQLAAAGLCREEVLAALRGVERERRAREDLLRQRVESGQATLVEARVTAQRRVLDSLAEIRDAMRKALTPHVEAVRMATVCARVEAAKLGRA